MNCAVVKKYDITREKQVYVGVGFFQVVKTLHHENMHGKWLFFFTHVWPPCKCVVFECALCLNVT